MTAPNISDKNKQLFERVKIGSKLLSLISSPNLIEVSTVELRLFMGDKQFRKILERIVRNSFSLDIHFLPSDEQDTLWSGVPRHSIVLFRYAFTVPLTVLDHAQFSEARDWTETIGKIVSIVPAISAFAYEYPLKRLRLKPHFLSDLLTRYVSMYVRLGSPDFTQHMVSEYVDQIGGW
jgi:hypothetical protein